MKVFIIHGIFQKAIPMSKFQYYNKSEAQKKVLAIHDISCIGRCSLTVALPILSACGINTGILPTAILSTHTGEFTGYVKHDLSDELLPMAEHISKVGLPIDALYSGYLANSEQVGIVKQIFNMFPNAKRFVDPAFADNGKLYAMMDMQLVERLRELISISDVIVPNITEAQFLIKNKCDNFEFNENEILVMAKSLADMGAKYIIITSINYGDNIATAFYSKREDNFKLFFNKKYDGVFHGTGDTFASSLLACLLNNISFENSINISLRFICKCIEKTLLGGEALRYGVRFEQVIPELISEIAKNAKN